MSKRILVTGANGQLGRQMRCVAASSCDSYIFTDVEELDITEREAVVKMVTEQRIDIIVNCAAYTAVDKAEEDHDKANLLNNIAPSYLAQAARSVGATLIHISTDYVFDGAASTPYTEQQSTSPIGVYGATKLAGEQSVIESGCKSIIIRTSWLYSVWGSNFVKSMLELTKQRDTLSVIFDQVGTPTYAGDLADVIGRIIATRQECKCGTYHFSNEGVCSWYDFAKMIAKLASNECKISPIHSWEYPAKVSRPHYSVLDKTKIKSTFALEIPHWVESLEKCINELKK